MNEQQYRYLISLTCLQARAFSNEPIAAGRRMRAGKICSSCKLGLPEPHTPGLKPAPAVIWSSCISANDVVGTAASRPKLGRSSQRSSPSIAHPRCASWRAVAMASSTNGIARGLNSTSKSAKAASGCASQMSSISHLEVCFNRDLPRKAGCPCRALIRIQLTRRRDSFTFVVTNSNSAGEGWSMNRG